MSQTINQTLSLPFDNDNEQSILAIMIGEESVIGDVIYMLKPEHFYIGNNKDLFLAVRNLYTSSKHVDIITVSQEVVKIHENPTSPYPSWAAYIVGISQKYYSTTVLRDHVSILIDMYNSRKLIETLYKGACDLSEKSPVGPVVETVAKALDDIQGMERTSRSTVDVGNEFDDMINRQEAGEDTGIRTDFRIFDESGGLKPGSTVVIGAYPSIGKSAFVTAMAYNIATNHNTPVGFISLEMPCREIYGRMISSLLYLKSRIDSNVPVLDVVQVLYNKSRRAPFETEAIREASKEIKQQTKITYIDNSATLSEIASSIRDLVVTKHVKVVFIDFLQIIMPDKESSYKRREEVLSEATRLFKILAKKYDICIVELSQLTPNYDNKSDRTPRYTDLKGAASIYENVDTVVLIHRPEKENDNTLHFEPPFENESIQGKAQLMVCKNRNGKNNISYIVGFNSPTTTFYETGYIEPDDSNEPF